MLPLTPTGNERTRRELNPRNLARQASALPLSYMCICGSCLPCHHKPETLLRNLITLPRKDSNLN